MPSHPGSLLTGVLPIEAASGSTNARSPCVGIKLPHPVPAELRPASTDEVLVIADFVPARYRALLLLTAGTGVRQGEAFGVILSNVDLDRAELRVDRQVGLRVGRPPELAPPKTNASLRTIPLPTGVTDALVEHFADFLATALPGLGSPLFTTPSRELIRRNRFGEVWRRAVRRSGVRPDLTLHDLRHYYASLLIRGESVKMVQRRLGHKTAQETLDTYGHLWPDSDGPTREAVDGELFRRRTLDGPPPNSRRSPVTGNPAAWLRPGGCLRG